MYILLTETYPQIDGDRKVCLHHFTVYTSNSYFKIQLLQIKCHVCCNYIGSMFKSNLTYNWSQLTTFLYLKNMLNWQND